MPRRATRKKRSSTRAVTRRHRSGPTRSNAPRRHRRTGGRRSAPRPVRHRADEMSWGSPFHANMTSCYGGNAADFGGGGDDDYMRLQRVYFGNMVTLSDVRASIGQGTKAAATRAKAAGEKAAEAGRSALDSIKDLFAA